MSDIVRYTAGYEHDLQGTPISETATVTVLREVSMCTISLESLEGDWSKDCTLDEARALFCALRLALGDLDVTAGARLPQGRIELPDSIDEIRVSPTEACAVELRLPGREPVSLHPAVASRLAGLMAAAAITANAYRKQGGQS